MVFYNTLKSAGHVLTQEESRRCTAAVDEFLGCQDALAAHFAARQVQLYHVTFKSHLLWHLSRQCQWLNPRHAWAYRDESFVGLVATVLRSVVMGGGPLRAGETLATKWRHLLWTRLLDRTQELERGM